MGVCLDLIRCTQRKQTCVSHRLLIAQLLREFSSQYDARIRPFCLYVNSLDTAEHSSPVLLQNCFNCQISKCPYKIKQQNKTVGTLWKKLSPGKCEFTWLHFFLHWSSMLLGSGVDKSCLETFKERTRAAFPWCTKHKEEVCIVANQR